jgi:GAF domain-containing protein
MLSLVALLRGALWVRPFDVARRTAPDRSADRRTRQRHGRTLIEGKAVQVPDVLADPEYMYLDHQKKSGARTILGVPLLREGSPIGVVLLYRSTVRPFTDKQIELVTTFADG